MNDDEEGNICDGDDVLTNVKLILNALYVVDI